MSLQLLLFPLVPGNPLGALRMSISLVLLRRLQDVCLHAVGHCLQVIPGDRWNTRANRQH